MNDAMLPDALFADYRALLAQLDAFGTRIRVRYGNQMRCRRGCADCCQHLSLSSVEGVFIRQALRVLPPHEREDLLHHAAHSGEDVCPLLQEDICLLYAARPVICRTHGLPLLYRTEDGPQVSCCPHNLAAFSAESLPGTDVLNMEVVNTTLAAIDVVFTRTCPSGTPKERRLLRDWLVN
ncbi:MAG: YkgJ family cysteine cluster protein [Deltaproteobacteria bacterium]|nr:YkgJ family cysteine cluster protein [Deltaproteobacteria bacterium]